MKLVFSGEKCLFTTAFARPWVRKVAGAVYLRNYSQILTIRAEHVRHFTLRVRNKDIANPVHGWRQLTGEGQRYGEDGKGCGGGLG